MCAACAVFIVARVYKVLHGFANKFLPFKRKGEPTPTIAAITIDGFDSPCIVFRHNLTIVELLKAYTSAEVFDAG